MVSSVIFDWDKLQNYYTGDKVKYNGRTWLAIGPSSPGIPPGITATWKPTRNKKIKSFKRMNQFDEKLL